MLLAESPISEQPSMIPIPANIMLLREQNSGLAAVSLPTELLAEIFRCACALTYDEDLTWTRPPSGPEGDDILRKRRGDIAGTCHRWLQVAINTRPLWSRIAVKLFGSDPDKDLFLPALPLLQLELQRSGEHPLNLKIAIHGRIKAGGNYFATLHSALRRCTALAINRHNGFHLLDFEYLIESPNPVSLPLLKTLTFFSYESMGHVVHLSGAPSLTTISLGCDVMFMPCPSSITSLTLTNAIWSESAIEILQSCRDTLEHLQWSFVGGWGPTDGAPGSLRLPALKRLSLLPQHEREDPRGVPIVLSPLAPFSAPQLTHLQISQFGGNPPPPPNLFPKLRYLSYRFMIYHDSGELTPFLQMLDGMPTLEELHFSSLFDAGDPDLVEWLCERDGESEKFKRLPRLSKVTANFAKVEIAAKLVEERSISSAMGDGSDSLFTLHLLECDEIFEELQARFPTNVLRGFDEVHFRPREW